MKYLLVFIYILLVGNTMESQETRYESFPKVELSPMGIDAGYEWRINDHWLWDNQIGMGAGMYINPNHTVNFTFDPSKPKPFIVSEMRWYYALDKRKNKGKSTANNSGNFVGLQTKYMWGSQNDIRFSSSMIVDLHWGIQRRLGTHFLFKFALGMGWYNDFEYNRSEVLPTLQIKFGYRF